ncbi:VOC family protein [Anaerorhabdus furcosa]|uniref:PhnB protein n=1 Tax=Anaerorhabdus furcosa TaxID=118967 RepID=A0A1T4PRF4_9FIRM|nr:VOC family protein [Anaerorhabdus furcosa]SJZ93861.1 PhnB protein [Anaerorhabdus furcosa]
MSVNVYFNFDGNCEEAVKYYANVFEVEPKIMKFGDMPGNPGYPMSDDLKNRVLHANMMIEGSQLMFSDTMPGMEFIVGNNLSLTVVTKDAEKLTQWFNKLAKEGFVVMPLEEAFFSELYGYVKDKYGVGWQFNLEKEQ